MFSEVIPESIMCAHRLERFSASSFETVMVPTCSGRSNEAAGANGEVLGVWVFMVFSGELGCRAAAQLGRWPESRSL